MIKDLISNFWGREKEENLVSVDIGSSTIKVMEFDLSGEKPKLKSAGFAATPAGAIQNNIITKPDAVGNVIRSIVESNGVTAMKVTTAVPGPCVFTKRITMPHSTLKELSQTIQFEAGNYIPHNINAVHLDYQIVSHDEKSMMEVLLVAVKNEIIESFIDAVNHSGMETAIVDVDYFALENMFDINYPEERAKTIGLVNVGARYSSVNIIQQGTSIFMGDVAIGGRLYTDALCESLNLKPLEAELAKTGTMPQGVDQHLFEETLERTTEQIVSELQRQIGFFWNAAATERSIDALYLTGGGSQVKGFLEELGAKTGIPCHRLEALRGVETLGHFDQDYLGEIASVMGVSVGLAARRIGDKVHAIQ